MDKKKLEQLLKPSREAEKLLDNWTSELNTEMTSLTSRIDEVAARRRGLNEIDLLSESIMRSGEAIEAQLIVELTSNKTIKSENIYDFAELINNTLELMRELLKCGEPFLVLHDNVDETPHYRKVRIAFSGAGTMSDPKVFQDEETFFLADNDDKDSKRAIIAHKTNWGVRQANNFSSIHQALSPSRTDMRIIRGCENIVEELRRMRETDLTAFLLASVELDGIVDLPEDLLFQNPEQVEEIIEGIAHCIAVGALRNAQQLHSDAPRTVSDSFFYLEVPEGYDHYLQLAEIISNQGDFSRTLPKIFGKDFSYQYIKDRALEIQLTYTQHKLDLKTALGVISVNGIAAEGEKLMNYRFPEPRSRQTGVH